MKVKDYPNLSKENGSVISTDSDAYQRRLAQIKQRRRIDELEEQNKKMGDDLKSLDQKMDTILRLLQEK